MSKRKVDKFDRMAEKAIHKVVGFKDITASGTHLAKLFAAALRRVDRAAFKRGVKAATFNGGERS